MALEAGTRFGSYEVTEPIGAGGMGEVWRATDRNLKRDVAIKVLPPAFANDEDRLARFQREAEVLAALNHPNIAQIYGLEKGEATTALVMELVEGPTLADRIEQGPLPSDETLSIARQIVDALEAAHAQGIVHRDLKPANIKLRPDGTVKVLDFGIAKALDARATISGSQPPQLTTPAMTQAGLVLGTAAYMSPEQARGMPLDQRADIWAFGCLLYEMLTAQPAFGGEDATVTLARVLERGADLGGLPAAAAPEIRRTIAACLEKDPRRRLHHMGDVRLVLDGMLASEKGNGLPNATRKSGPGWALTATAVIAALAAGTLISRPGSQQAANELPITRFVIRAPDDAPIGIHDPLALSPHGRELVYVTGFDDRGRLFRQSLDDFREQPLEGTDGARGVLFSALGDEIAFNDARANQLLRLGIDGGSPTRLLETVDYFGADWGTDGTLVFASLWGTPLRVLRPDAQQPVALTEIDIAAGENSHIWPELLPDDRSVLFTIWSGDPAWSEAGIAVADLETGAHTVVLENGASGRYAESGHLVFWRADALWAVPFDLDSLSVTGTEQRVVPDVRLNLGQGNAHFAISADGTLAYVEGQQENFVESFIVDRAGTVLRRLDSEVATGNPLFSPDGRRVALTLYRGGTFAVGVLDLTRNVLDTVWNRGDSSEPTWIDNERLSFESNFEGDYLEYAIRADGSGLPEGLFESPQGYGFSAATWSADGRQLVYAKPGPDNRGIWILEAGTGAEPRVLIDSAADETQPEISPDGRFIAYQSDESGNEGIYVRSFPDVEAFRTTVTPSAGRAPAWSDDGAALYYAAPEGLMEVPVNYDERGTPDFGLPELLFPMTEIRDFDVAPDGESFAIERRPIERGAREIRVVLNWFEELNRLVPVE